MNISPENHVSPDSKPLTLWGMVAIIFFAVSGGPFGSEEAVASVGPFWVLIGFVIFPLLWSIPEALMTAELSTMFPGNGGYVFWTTAAFGPRLGFMQGFWSWLSNVTSIAVYPHLLLQYLSAEVPSLNTSVNSALFLTAFTLAMSYINYRGLHVIGSGGAVAIVLVLAPFAVLGLIGFPHVVWEELAVGASFNEVSPLTWISFLNIMFWNLNSWENCSVLSGEIAEPQKTLPKAILIALLITVTSYLVPLTIGIGVMSGVSHYSKWAAGYFQAVGYQVGGKPMAFLILFAATVGCIGQYQSILCSSAYSLQSLGEIGMLPAFMAKRSRYDTPTVGIAVATVIVLCLTTLGFADIVQLLNSVYCLSLLVEFSTLVHLRAKCKDMHRPFKIPLSTFWILMMIAPATLTVVAMLLVPPIYGQFMTSFYMLGGTISAFLIYHIVEIGRSYAWFEFCDSPPKNHLDVVQRLKVF
jgi:amino acid transporter